MITTTVDDNTNENSNNKIGSNKYKQKAKSYTRFVYRTRVVCAHDGNPNEDNKITNFKSLNLIYTAQVDWKHSEKNYMW